MIKTYKEGILEDLWINLETIKFFSYPNQPKLTLFNFQRFSNNFCSSLFDGIRKKVFGEFGK